MPWGYAAGAAVGLLGDAMKDDKNGGAGAQQQQTSKEPWAAAQPWLLQNIAQGQNLQQGLQAQPFSPQQQAAYGNQYAQSDYMRRLIPSLLGQLGGQPLGYSQTDPKRRPQAFDWAGLLGSGPDLGQTQLSSVKTPAPAPQMLVDDGTGTFVQQSEDPYNAWQMAKFRGSTGLMPDPSVFGQPRSDGGPAVFGGGFGQFKYGQDAPQPGTKAYRDMQEYFMYGGTDPYNLYGKKAGAQPAGLLGWDTAGGGIGDTGANAAAAASGNTAW